MFGFGGDAWKKELCTHCTYNVTMGRVRATIVAVEKQWVLQNLRVYVCSLRYPACNAHAPYCHLWPARITNFFHIISEAGRFSKKKKVTEHKMCSDFL